MIKVGDKVKYRGKSGLVLEITTWENVAENVYGISMPKNLKRLNGKCANVNFGGGDIQHVSIDALTKDGTGIDQL